MTDLQSSTPSKPLIEQLQNERDELQRKLDRIVEITSGIIYMLDPDGNFLFVNNAVKEILCYSPEDLIGKHFSMIMSAQEYSRVARSVVLPKMQNVTAAGDSAPKLFDERRTGARRTRNLEVQLQTCDRQNVRVMAGDVTGILGVEGAYDKHKISDTSRKEHAFLGSQGIIYDITKYKEIEKEKIRFQQKLFEIQKMEIIGDLAGRIAHNFNNKLTSIIGCAELLKEEFSRQGTANEYIDPLIKTTNSTLDLTRQLISFAKRDEVDAGPVNAGAVIRDVAAFLEHTIDKNIRIEKTIKATTPQVTGKYNQLLNAVLNAAVNSCDAMPGGGVLGFTVAGVVLTASALKQWTAFSNCRPGDYVHISIQDTGCGMHDETKSRMFEPFYSTKQPGRSIGLGMCTIQQCVRDHGGFLTIESSVGKGTSVDLYIPVRIS